MGLQTKELEIDADGVTLQVKTTQLDAMKALRLATRLLKIIAAGGGDRSSEGIGRALMLLDGDEVLAIAREVLARTIVVVPGSGAISLTDDMSINRAFEGRLMALLRTIKFAVEVNFAGFFTGAAQSGIAAPTP